MDSELGLWLSLWLNFQWSRRASLPSLPLKYSVMALPRRSSIRHCECTADGTATLMTARAASHRWSFIRCTHESFPLPSGSKDPNNRVLGLKYYNIIGIWALKPYYLESFPLHQTSTTSTAHSPEAHSFPLALGVLPQIFPWLTFCRPQFCSACAAGPFHL